MLTSASTVLLAGLLLGLSQQPPTTPVPPVAAVQPPSAQPPAAGEQQEAALVAAEDLPVSLDRIQRGIAQPPAIRLELDRPIFRTEVVGRRPTIVDILGPDFARGAANYGGMTHQEFLNMVTPRDVQGAAAFSNAEAMTVFGTSAALQWALQRALQRYRDARTARELDAAKREVEEALRALDRARQKAGLPPR
jgi:hypothetical protein